jgi:hypothetical protein
MPDREISEEGSRRSLRWRAAAQRSFDQRYRIEVEWQPIRSVRTGNELAAQLEASIEPLRQEVVSTESRIAELMA